MHSFHRSRGRILFEVLCAYAISASFAGAWMQIGASALLAASSVVALYGLVHAFDLFRRDPAAAVEPQRIEFQSEAQIDLPARQDADTPMMAAADERLPTDNAVEESQLVEPAAPRAKAGRPAKAPRKSGGRRANAPKEAKITVPAPTEEAEATELVFPEEAAHISHAPLFEPEPFVRQQRLVFGRKAG